MLSTKEIVQTASHSPMIGYAIDRFGIYRLLDKNGNKHADLDECAGHYDDKRGIITTLENQEKTK